MYKRLLIIPIAAIMFACGGEAETESEGTEESSTDSTATDSVEVVVEEDGTVYFEDYAQYDTKTKLYEAFDADNLKDEIAYYAEGTVEIHTTVLTDPETGYQIQFAWEEEDQETLDFIETWGVLWMDDPATEQKVETKCGIYTGMPLEEVVAWNGADFEFSGFGWDYAGGVFGGKDDDAMHACDVDFTLTMLDEGYDDYLHLLGDVVFKTSDDEVKGAPIVIQTITYRP